jgi:AraC-like DNA-binding protein
MLNAIQIIRTDPQARVFEVDGLVFAQFTCPAHDQPLGIWAETDHFAHVLSGKSTWKTCAGTCSAGAGETLFFKKGSYVLPPKFEEHLCIELFFIPDLFVKETVLELAASLPPLVSAANPGEPAMPVTNDLALTAFFEAMTIYFRSHENPSETLLKLKVKELLASILLGRSNAGLSAYFRTMAVSDAPSIAAVMESNFQNNLSIDDFARICNRSVSSFKREFRKQYGTSPGKWLLERRLQLCASLLQSTGMSVTEIAFHSGFEDLSHFSRVFKERFRCSPSMYRQRPAPVNHSSEPAQAPISEI